MNQIRQCFISWLARLYVRWRKIMKIKEKLEFNKLVVGASVALAFTLTIFICIFKLVTRDDVTDLVTLTGIVWVEVSVVTGAYSWKTKTLNKIKMISTLPSEIIGNIDPNQILNN